MVWLNAVLAFVVSMILFSTIVSAVTESLHRIFHMRESGLRAMLGRLFDEIVWPQLSQRLAPHGAEEARRNFLEVLMRNRAVDETGPLRLLGYWFAPRNLSALPTAEFVQRLAETHVGKALAGAAVPVDTTVKDLARNFERFGGDASAYFQQRAKAVSITVAIAVAFVLNVDAVRLFSTLLINPELTQRLIAVGEKQQQAAASPAAVSPARAGDAPDDKPKEDLPLDQQVGDLVQGARREAAALAAFGLPIGAAYFPWCRAPSVGKECEEAGDLFVSGGRYAHWLLFTLLSGLLIGMGGPFWFDTFARLSGVMQVVKNVSAGGRPSGGATDSDAATAPVVPPPVSAGDAFRAALPAPAAAPRILLSSRGQPL